MRRNSWVKFMLFSVLISVVTVGMAFSTDLAEIARKSKKAKEKSNEGAKAFINALTANDPIYYPSRHGLNSFSCRIRCSLIDQLAKEYADRCFPKREPEIFAHQMFWLQPDRFFIPTEDFEKQISMKDKGFTKELYLVPLYVAHFAPTVFDDYTHEYQHQPASPWPHVLTITPKDSNFRRVRVELRYDASWLLQETVQHYGFAKDRYFAMEYKDTPQGKLLIAFRHESSFRKYELTSARLNWRKLSKYYFLESLQLNPEEIVDTSRKKYFPITFTMVDVVLNPQIDDFTRNQMMKLF